MFLGWNIQLHLPQTCNMSYSVVAKEGGGASVGTRGHGLHCSGGGEGSWSVSVSCWVMMVPRKHKGSWGLLCSLGEFSGEGGEGWRGLHTSIGCQQTSQSTEGRGQELDKLVAGRARGERREPTGTQTLLPLCPLLSPRRRPGADDCATCFLVWFPVMRWEDVETVVFTPRCSASAPCDDS